MKLRSKICLMSLVVLFLSGLALADSWSIKYEHSTPQDKNGSGVPSRGIAMFRVYEGLLKVNVDSANNALAISAESFSYYGNQAQGENGYLFCIFLKAKTCDRCSGDGISNDGRRCVQCDGSGKDAPTGSNMSDYVISTSDMFVQFNGRTQGSIQIPDEADFAVFLVSRNYTSSKPSNYSDHHMDRGVYSVLGKHGRYILNEMVVKRNR